MLLTRRSRRAVTKATATALLAAAALVGPAMAPFAAHASSHRSGVNLAATDPRFGVAEAASDPAVADQLGARWTRIPFLWNYIQPTGPSSWNPFVLSAKGSDTVINDELSRGREVVGLLMGSPTWAELYPKYGRNSAPTNLDKPWNDPQNYWGAFCYKLAQHYAGKINNWIVWNEVSIPTGADGSAGVWTQWYGGPTEDDSIRTYATLLEVAYQAIHAANPQAKLVMYGDPYWYDKGTYLTKLYRVLAHDDPGNKHDGYFDVANLHLYIGAPSFYWIVGDLRRQLRSHGWGNKQVWISETNVEPYDDPTYPAPHTRFRVSLDAQAGFLVDAFAVDLAAKVDRIEVYRMQDGAEAAHHLGTLGLLDSKGQVRPVGHTFKFLISLFKDVKGGSYTTGELYPDPRIGGKAGVYKVVTGKAGERITVLWNQAGAHASYVKPYRKQDGITYDAHDNIVMPLKDPQGVSYDANGTATYRLPAHASTATIYDKFGNALTLRNGQTAEINNHNDDGSIRAEKIRTYITLKGGVYTVQLRGGTDYTNPDDPRIPTVGGDPVIIVEATK